MALFRSRFVVSQATSPRPNPQSSSRSSVAATLLVLLCGACGDSSDDATGPGTLGAPGAPEPDATAETVPLAAPEPDASSEAPSTAPTAAATPEQTLIEGVPEASPVDQAPEPKGDCGSSEVEATLVTEPVDIIIVIDNSGSMSPVVRAVEKNINVNFANILGQADIDYRVIMVSRYGERRQSICIEAPLSGAASCSPAAELPIFSDRFFHYSVQIDSHDTFTQILRSYRHETNSDSDRKESSGGWQGYLRETSRKVFLEFTDDEAEDMAWQDFDRKLLALDPAQFGTEADRRYRWHSIVGMNEKPNPTEAWAPDEPIQQGMCGKVEAPGVHYQELSRLTGGLRFPLCRTDSYDVVFQRIASDVITHTRVDCDYPVPPAPAGKTHDLSKVAVAYTPAPSAPVQTYAQAADLASCQVDAFYIADNQIYLCPETCSLLNDTPTESVSVLFTCESTLLVPPRVK